jgi:hypothetical protein
MKNRLYRCRESVIDIHQMTRPAVIAIIYLGKIKIVRETTYTDANVKLYRIWCRYQSRAEAGRAMTVSPLTPSEIPFMPFGSFMGLPGGRLFQLLLPLGTSIATLCIN